MSQSRADSDEPSGLSIRPPRMLHKEDIDWQRNGEHRIFVRFPNQQPKPCVSLDDDIYKRGGPIFNIYVVQPKLGNDPAAPVTEATGVAESFMVCDTRFCRVCKPEGDERADPKDSKEHITRGHPHVHLPRDCSKLPRNPNLEASYDQYKFHAHVPAAPVAIYYKQWDPEDVVLVNVEFQDGSTCVCATCGDNGCCICTQLQDPPNELIEKEELEKKSKDKIVMPRWVRVSYSAPTEEEKRSILHFKAETEIPPADEAKESEKPEAVCKNCGEPLETHGKKCSRGKGVRSKKVIKE